MDDGQEEYIRRVLEAYRQTPGTAGTVRRPDRVLAGQLYQRGVSVTVNDPIGTANHATDAAMAAAQHQRDGAENLALDQVGKTPQRITEVKAGTQRTTAVSGSLSSVNYLPSVAGMRRS